MATVAAVIALFQLHASSEARKVDRVIKLHEDLTTGEVGAARDRFAMLMWRLGEYSAPGARLCFQPDFDSMISTDDVSDGGAGQPLDRYTEELRRPGPVDPLQDLYKVMWCFERVDGARRRSTLDDKLLVELVGFHAVWWDYLLANVTESDTGHRGALKQLAAEMSYRNPHLTARVAPDFAWTSEQSG